MIAGQIEKMATILTVLVMLPLATHSSSAGLADRMLPSSGRKGSSMANSRLVRRRVHRGTPRYVRRPRAQEFRGSSSANLRRHSDEGTHGSHLACSRKCRCPTFLGGSAIVF